MSIVVGETIGVVLVLEKLQGEPSRFMVRCRCDSAFEMHEASLIKLKEQVAHRDTVAFEPYVCRCKYDVRYWSGQSSGMTDSPEYQTWNSLIGGCHNKHHQRYKHLGKKGYSVCKKWRDSFDAFLDDLGRRPTRDHVLLIESSKKTYGPTTCKWVAREEWRRSRKQASLYEFDGQSKPATEWAEIFSEQNHIPVNVNLMRILRGWTKEKILSQSGAKRNVQ